MNWFKKLARRLGKRTSAVTPRTTPTRLGVERMEDRLTPVMGAWAVPPAVANGAFDGVVMVSQVGSGSLLASGQHILTAAHVVDRDGDRVPDRANEQITFQVVNPAGVLVPITMQSVRTTIHPNWNGDASGNGFDVAIIELPALAPVTADRYDLWRNRATDPTRTEVGRTFTVVGYGATGTGLTGHDSSYGVKRQGTNVFDQADVATARLQYDFDSGQAVHNWMGDTGLGAAESNHAPGDSGGPLFLDGRIAGVVSHSTRDDRAFGDRKGVARVSDLLGWIDANSARKSVLRIDMASQIGANDGSADPISALVDGGYLILSVNGKSISTPVSGVEGVSIVGSNDAEWFVVDDDILATSAWLQIDGLGGDDAFTLAGSRRHDWQITGFNSGVSVNGRVFPSNVENLTGGAGDDNFQFLYNGQISGRVSGGAGGFDMLDYRYLNTTGVKVDLTMGTASRVGRGVSDFRGILGSEGNDTLIGNEFANIIHGMGGNDSISGQGGNDYLYGNGGHDTLAGGEGEDWLYGNDGNDTLDGGRDGIKDHLYGGPGQDTFTVHYNPFVKGGLTYWFPELDDTDYDSTTDVVVRRYW